MDPTVCLTQIKELIKEINYQEIDHNEFSRPISLIDVLTDLVLDLDEWLSKGGFLPDQWNNRRGRPYRTSDGDIVETAKHGTRGGYNVRCRCMSCTLANRLKRNLTTDEMKGYDRADHQE